MNTQSFVDGKVANLIYETGRKYAWWPFSTKADFHDFVRTHPLKLRGKGTHLVVGLDHDHGIVVRECESITDAVDVGGDAFVVTYAYLTERVIYECMS